MPEIYKNLVDLFLEWNSKINLSAIRDRKGVELKHIQDSLFWDRILKDLANWKKIKVVDVWTGSGFPLLPLAMENPEFSFLWIESVKKKVNAVNDIIEKLWLKNVKVIWSRAEDYKKEKFDVLTARAVAYIDKLLKYTYHLVESGWYFLLYKLNSEEEYKDILKNCQKYNLELVWKYPYKLYDGDIERVIYVLKKN